jgi:hypothetical protein
MRNTTPEMKRGSTSNEKKEDFSISKIKKCTLKRKRLKSKNPYEKRGFGVSKMRNTTPESKTGSTSDEKRGF